MTADEFRTPSTPAVDAALDYISRGWVIFPLWPTRGENCDCTNLNCRSQGKHPVWKSSWLSAQVSQLDRDPEARVRSTWSGQDDQYGDLARRGIAVDLGASGLMIIDLDSAKAAEDWFSGKFGMLRTLSVKTGRERGGYHLYYRQFHTIGRCGNLPIIRSVSTQTLTRTHGTVATEVKGTGGYAVLPPTLHASGRKYEWLDEVAACPVPNELADWIHRAGGREHGVRKPRIGDRRGDGSQILNPPGLAMHMLELLESARSGDRNNAATKAALAFTDIVATGWCTAAEAKEMFLIACRRQELIPGNVSLLDDEPVKTLNLWERLGPHDNG